MKNISRRVFIKGLAVAGVAAAASTVLAGCNTNMIPDVDNGTGDDTTDETPAKEQVVTVTDNAGKKLTITAGNCTFIKSSKMVVLSFDVDNETDTDWVIASKATAANSGKYYTLNASTAVKAYFDGDETNAGTVDTATGTNLFAKVAKVAKGSYNVYITDAPSSWEKVTLSFDIMKGAAAPTNDYLIRPAEFTFENK